MNAASIRKAFVDELTFLRSLASRPSMIGAIAPSSQALARAIAAQVDPLIAGYVLELGPGTGAITGALLAAGISAERVIAVEYDRDLAVLVRKRFGVRVICGDAFNLSGTLGNEFGVPFAAVVSGLPLLNQPMARRRALVESALARVAPGGTFVQFSYGLNPPVPACGNFSVVRAARVLANIPPAQVWVYRSTLPARTDGNARPSSGSP